MVLQLAKTTPYLSGQQRIDIELKKDSGYISTGNIHIVPLSDNVIYNENDKRVAFNYSHEDNIKYLFSQTQDTFWTDVKERKDTLYYIPEEINVDLYDHTYQSGTKRARYKRYNKQFSCLVPMWIDCEWQDDWCFKVEVKSDNINIPTNVSSLILNLSSDFKKYLKDYTNGISSELLNINSDRKDATITGLNVSSGINNFVDVSYVYDNLLSRERPLIEFDSMLCGLFEENKMIAKQLINFNFVFNVEDILSYASHNQLYGSRFRVIFQFGKLDQNNTFIQFPYKDIYTNYDFIPSYEFNSFSGDSYVLNNVLDYLEDNRCVDFIYINKTTQPICHWTLVEKPDYIYNFYDGFCPIYNDERVSGSYYGMPRIEQDTYNEAFNNMAWCKNYSGINMTTQDVLSLIDRVDECATKIDFHLNESDSDSHWVEWLKYSNPFINDTSTHDFDTFLELAKTNGYEEYIMILDSFNSAIENCLQYTITINNIDYHFGLQENHTNGQNKFLLILSPYKVSDNTPNRDQFILKEFIESEISFSSLSEVYYAFKYIQFILSKPIPPVKFVFDRGIIPIKASVVNNESTEIEYLKANKNTYSFVYRYTDHLQPLFIDCNDDEIEKLNVFFYNSEWKCNRFDDVNSVEVQNYNNGIISNEKPVYPSIGYFPLSKVEFDGITNGDNTHYNYLPVDYVSPENRPPLDEFCWFNRSLTYFLPPVVELSFQLTSPYSQEDVEDHLKNSLETYFTDMGCNFNDFENNIWPLYDYSVNFEYSNEIINGIQDINTINYYITYTLR